MRYAFYDSGLSLLAETTFAPGVPAVAYDYVWFAGRPVAQIDAGARTGPSEIT